MTREERDDLRRSASSEYAPGHGPNGPAWQSIVLRLLDAIDAAEDCRLVARFPCGECRGCREAEREQLERELAATKDCAGPVNGEDPCGDCKRCLKLELDQAKDCSSGIEEFEDGGGRDVPREDLCGGECRACLSYEIEQLGMRLEIVETELGERELLGRELGEGGGSLPIGADLGELLEYARHTLIAHHELAVERARGLLWISSVRPAIAAAANLRNRTPEAIADCVAIVQRVHRNLHDVGVAPTEGGAQ